MTVLMEVLFLFGKHGSFPFGVISEIFSSKIEKEIMFFVDVRQKKKLCARCHAEHPSLRFCKSSLVFKLVTAPSHAEEEEGDSLSPPSNLHVSLQFHFLHSSHARSIVPRVFAANTVTSSREAD